MKLAREIFEGAKDKYEKFSKRQEFEIEIKRLFNQALNEDTTRDRISTILLT